MFIKILTVVISLGAGFAAGNWLTAEPAGETFGAEPRVSATYFDATAPADERIRALEQTVADERNARLILEDQLHALLLEIERIDTSGPRVIASQVEAMQRNRDDVQSRSGRASEQRDYVANGASSYHTARIDRLVRNGVTPERAEWMLQRESAAQFEALEAEFAAARAGESVNPMASSVAAQSLLRSDLGEADYEKYLWSSGQPTAVVIQNVMGSSPAARAGIQAGDRLVSYGGTRIFNMTELRSQAMQGTSGEDVVLEVMRNGTRLQITLPRGPMGINGVGTRMPILGHGGG